MNNKMERILLWWMQCVTALAQGLAADKSGKGDTAGRRFDAALATYKEAQELAVRAMQRFADLTPHMDETKQRIARLQGKPKKEAPTPPTEPGEGAAIVVVDAEAAPCVHCDGEVGMGPIGWRQGDEPGSLCTLCLARASPDLGALLGLVCHLRRAALQAAEETDAPDATDARLLELARRYARANAKGWPVRPTGFVESVIEGHLKLVERYGPEYLHEMRRQPGAGGQEPS